MREDGGWDAIIAARGHRNEGRRARLQLRRRIESRLTGATRRPITPSSATDIRPRGVHPIPWAVAKDKKGWLEDRRPNANMDPYVVSRLITDTVCSDAAGSDPGPPVTRNGSPAADRPEGSVP